MPQYVVAFGQNRPIICSNIRGSANSGCTAHAVHYQILSAESHYRPPVMVAVVTNASKECAFTYILDRSMGDSLIYPHSRPFQPCSQVIMIMKVLRKVGPVRITREVNICQSSLYRQANSVNRCL